MIPPIRKIRRNPRANSIGAVNRTRPPHIVPIHEKYRTALGMAMTKLAAEKKPIAVVGSPVANMWWTHTPKLMNAMPISAATCHR